MSAVVSTAFRLIRSFGQRRADARNVQFRVVVSTAFRLIRSFGQGS